MSSCSRQATVRAAGVACPPALVVPLRGREIEQGVVWVFEPAGGFAASAEEHARLVRERAGQRVAVVTHGGVLDMVYRTATGQSLSGPRQSVIPNGGISRVRMDETAVEILSWAETQHLEGMPAQPVYDQRRLAPEVQAETASPSVE